MAPAHNIVFTDNWDKLLVCIVYVVDSGRISWAT